MPSRLITPPDIVSSSQPYLIINAFDSSVDTVALWLRVSKHQLDLYLFHSQMTEHIDWAASVACSVPVILVNHKYKSYIIPPLSMVLETKSQHVVYFGPGTEYTELLEYFLKNLPE